MGSRRYVVEQFTLFDGWVNVWTDTEYDPVTEEEKEAKPIVFNSKREAKEALEFFLQEEQEAYELGNIEAPYLREEFRITRVDNAKEGR
jgi:hypothetical protein